MHDAGHARVLAGLAAISSLVGLACAPGSGDSGEGGPTRVESGLLGCAPGDSCTIVALSQTVDERVELYTARASAGDVPLGYRGALDLDLEPSPLGDISSDALDEPYGLAWDGAALHVLIGHYPAREVGSLLSMPAAGLVDYALGSSVDHSDWFDTGAATGALGAGLVSLGYEEAHGLLVHPRSGTLLASVFGNDLSAAEEQWQGESQLVQLGSAGVGAGVGELSATALGCAGAWDLAALDADADAVALACDGDERLVILDADSLASGGSPSVRCTAQIPFNLKRVRQLAADGLGGVLLVETPRIISTTEVARLWWFDGDCALREVSELMGALSWQVRDLIPVPGPAPRWLLARAFGDERGVFVLAGDPSTGMVEPCLRLSAFDDAGAWASAQGEEDLSPLALALTRDGSGLAISTGPLSYPTAGPGYGSLWWAELELGTGEDSCTASIDALDELGATAPAVSPDAPETWRRAPEVLTLIEWDES